MRILVFAAMFPPNNIGGAEVSALNLSEWLAKQGHEVGVVMAAKERSEEQFGVKVGSLTVWSIYMPRAYPVFYAHRAKQWQKPYWHLQDHFDPRNRSIVKEIVDKFRPDYCNVHYIQGLGYNALRELAAQNLPTMFILHDLGLVCFRMAMFKNGQECESQCFLCRASSNYKAALLGHFRRIGFVSPSQANLDKVGKYFPLSKFKTAKILNANSYPSPTVERKESEALRFIFVGRLHSSKGIDLLLSAAEKLSSDYTFHLTVVGSGPDEKALHDQYKGCDWLEFTGQIPQQEVINLMVNSDMLCIPSIWLENSPGVVIQALSVGLPAMGSDKGGIPELIRHGYNGLLIAPGVLADWYEALKAIIDDPAQLSRYRSNALAVSPKYQQDALGASYVTFMEEIRDLDRQV